MSKKILIVEDNDFLKSLFSSKLQERKEWEIFTATDGEMAIEVALKEVPDIIFLDLILPKKTGFDVIEALRNDPKMDEVVIIILSVLGQKSDIERATALGANDYIIKSEVSMDEITHLAETYLD